MPNSLTTRLRHAWNAFNSRDPTSLYDRNNYGHSSFVRQDMNRIRVTNERSVIVSIYNRIALDVAALKIQHVRLDQNDRYSETIDSNLNYVLTEEANIDQTARSLIHDIVLSMFDEGVVAVVPVDTTLDPTITGAFDISTMRTGKILEWFPQHVRIKLYNENSGLHEEVVLPKRMVAIIENPLYAVMNEPNSTLKRLLRKLSILDAIDEQSGAGKLDIIIQLPYVIKSETRKKQAEERRKDIEVQLSGSKYGIAYTDGTERITQLNRPAENNLMAQIQYLTTMLYSQLGLTEEVFNGTASEAVMLNYNNRTINPIIMAIIDEFRRKFLTKTARTQNQSIVYFKDVFSLATVDKIAEIADKFTRNEILSSNEVRSIIGYKPAPDPNADALKNKNISSPDTMPPQNMGSEPDVESDQSEESSPPDERDAVLQDLLSSITGILNSELGIDADNEEKDKILLELLDGIDEDITKIFGGE